ncbi:hypothetical protein FGG90_07535 [Clavibacter tessellarius]|uniref:Uncharacterized protein n=1 Tax=Clavibacter tessellarius TaxID=31965 RepID=A0A225CN32_9MICO|nr:hypothetical protein [Clavibacter michiganensis]OQJ63152.1 hypothetical protein B5P24_09185 [Clavibacter michiganensis subsp. tessellarius]UKF33867.1 hypothetical protein FGG90_07535 [Clavibacter michiganensis subsp. tessellarius]
MNADWIPLAWDLIKEVAIPVAAILIPTRLAVRIAREEREAAASARLAEKVGDEQEEAERRRETGALSSMQVMDGLVRAAFEVDDRRRDEILILGRPLITSLTLSLQAEHAAVWGYVTEEINTVLGGVRDRVGHQPRHAQQINDRSSRFTIVMIEWLQGDRPDVWFRRHVSVPLEETPHSAAGL